MFAFLCKRLYPRWSLAENLANTPLQIIRVIPTAISFINSLSSSSDNTSFTVVKDAQQPSSTVSYLVNSCGLSLESAISSSKKVRFKTPRKPDSVLTLLRDHGFTETQITKLIRTRPGLLMADPEKTLLPKIEFFRSIGFSSTELAKLLASNPAILGSSLENLLKPWYDFLKSILLEDTKVVRAMKNSPRIFNQDVQKNVVPNTAALMELGVPEFLILLTVMCYSPIVLQNRDKFEKIVVEVTEMGFDRKKTEFIHAMKVLSGTSRSTREHKMEVYRRWGWSEDNVQVAFKKYPLLLKLSEKKIMGNMDFLLNKLGCQNEDIARYPFILQFSLEKRVIPRCSVIKVLLSKALIKNDVRLSTFLMPNDKCFLEKFVTKYQEDIPQLLDVYKGK